MDRFPSNSISPGISKAGTLIKPGAGLRAPASSSSLSTGMRKHYERAGSAAPQLESTASRSSSGTTVVNGPTRATSEEPGSRTAAASNPRTAVASTEENDKSGGDTTFGAGGRLLPSSEDESVFWVDIEGKSFMFQLSLCGVAKSEQGNGNGNGGATGKRKSLELADEVLGDVDQFEENKISFVRFVDDASILTDERLVIKWGST